jgi:hypothetical protein
LLSQSGVGSLAIGGGIAPSAWLSPLSMPSYLSAWESVMMSSSWLAIAAIAAPTCCEETDILSWGGMLRETQRHSQVRRHIAK